MKRRSLITAVLLTPGFSAVSRHLCPASTLVQRIAYCGFVFHRLGGGIDLGQSQRLFPLGRANDFELTVGEFPQWHGATILCPLVDALPLS